jgi:UDP-N-acetylglucosamine 2-epimerase (non-hydrolysing)
MTLRVLTVFGTRPEAIKLAPVVQALAGDHRFESRLCVTAQHRHMLDQVLAVFGIVPDHDLGLMRDGQTLHGLTAAALTGTGAVIADERPDLVIVQGDTATAFAAALAAFYHQVPVVHVEAGLRTGDLAAPFPEEASRMLVSRLTALHCCPTTSNRDHLLAEGVAPDLIEVTGNTVVDALLSVRDRVAAQPAQAFAELLGAAAPALADPDRPMLLVTGHRREHFGAAFAAIVEGVRGIAAACPELAVVWPVHLNPQVRGPVTAGLAQMPNVFLIEPVDYLSFVWLMNRSTVILTDSGGIQEEAPSLGKPVLILRVSTERPEALLAGSARLVGTDPERIVAEAVRLLGDPAAREAMTAAGNPFGDGQATGRIIEAMVRRFGRRPGGAQIRPSE